MSVLVLWILEIYLNQLGSLRDLRKEDSADYKNLEEEFLQFMGQKLVTVLSEIRFIIYGKGNKYFITFRIALPKTRKQYMI